MCEDFISLKIFSLAKTPPTPHGTILAGGSPTLGVDMARCMPNVKIWVIMSDHVYMYVIMRRMYGTSYVYDHMAQSMPIEPGQKNIPEAADF